MTFEQWMAEFHPEIDLLTLGQGVPTQNLIAEYERFLAGDKEDLTPKIRTFEEFMADEHPDVDLSSLGLEALKAFQEEWRKGKGTVVKDPVIPEVVTEAPDFWEWADTKFPGWRNQSDEFVKAHRAKAWALYQQEFNVTGLPPWGSVVYQNEDGHWVHDLNGSIWTSEADAMADYNTTLESQEFQETLTGDIEEWQADIERITGEQTAEARRLAARDVGKISRGVREALLSQGVSPEDIEQRLAGGFESSARSLRDLETQIGLQSQQALAGAEQFGIQGRLSAEQLSNVQRQLAQSQTQFQQGLAESVRQFGLSQAQQQGQFTAGLGFSQQQFGEQVRQFGQQRRAVQRAQDPFSSLGNFFDFGGDIISSIFS